MPIYQTILLNRNAPNRSATLGYPPTQGSLVVKAWDTNKSPAQIQLLIAVITSPIGAAKIKLGQHHEYDVNGNLTITDLDTFIPDDNRRVQFQMHSISGGTPPQNVTVTIDDTGPF